METFNIVAIILLAIAVIMVHVIPVYIIWKFDDTRLNQKKP